MPNVARLALACMLIYLMVYVIARGVETVRHQCGQNSVGGILQGGYFAYSSGAYGTYGCCNNNLYPAQ